MVDRARLTDGTETRTAVAIVGTTDATAAQP
jgi:hypothetical protein